MQDLLRRQPGTIPRKWVCVYYVQRRLIRGYLDNLLMDREHSFHPIRHRNSGILIYERVTNSNINSFYDFFHCCKSFRFFSLILLFFFHSFSESINQGCDLADSMCREFVWTEKSQSVREIARNIIQLLPFNFHWSEVFSLYRHVDIFFGCIEGIHLLQGTRSPGKVRNVTISWPINHIIGIPDTAFRHMKKWGVM